MELLNYPCSPKDQNTLLTRKPKKLHPMINNHTQTHIKQIKIKSTKNRAVTYPTVEDDNFEIKPALIYLVQQNQFFGSPTEDPNLHISTFLRLSGTLKENQEAVRLHLFPFSLRDKASAWFPSLQVGSITSWDQMRQTFLAQFFPPSKTAKLRNQTHDSLKKMENLFTMRGSVSKKCLGFAPIMVREVAYYPYFL